MSSDVLRAVSRDAAADVSDRPSSGGKRQRQDLAVGPVPAHYVDSHALGAVSISDFVQYITRKLVALEQYEEADPVQPAWDALVREFASKVREHPEALFLQSYAAAMRQHTSSTDILTFIGLETAKEYYDGRMLERKQQMQRVEFARNMLTDMRSALSDVQVMAGATASLDDIASDARTHLLEVTDLMTHEYYVSVMYNIANNLSFIFPKVMIPENYIPLQPVPAEDEAELTTPTDEITMHNLELRQEQKDIVTDARLKPTPLYSRARIDPRKMMERLGLNPDLPNQAEDILRKLHERENDPSYAPIAPYRPFEQGKIEVSAHVGSNGNRKSSEYFWNANIQIILSGALKDGNLKFGATRDRRRAAVNALIETVGGFIDEATRAAIGQATTVSEMRVLIYTAVWVFARLAGAVTAGDDKKFEPPSPYNLALTTLVDYWNRMLGHFSLLDAIKQSADDPTANADRAKKLRDALRSLYTMRENAPLEVRDRIIVLEAKTTSNMPIYGAWSDWVSERGTLVVTPLGRKINAAERAVNKAKDLLTKEREELRIIDHEIKNHFDEFSIDNDKHLPYEPTLASAITSIAAAYATDIYRPDLPSNAEIGRLISFMVRKLGVAAGKTAYYYVLAEGKAQPTRSMQIKMHAFAISSYHEASRYLRSLVDQAIRDDQLSDRTLLDEFPLRIISL